MKPPIVTLLTDFGSSDHYVAAMKGVMLGICPAARMVDISHEIAPFAIAEAAFTLGQAWQCFPRGTVHLIVVDPGVGSARRPILAEAEGHRFVAPDNGVLTMVLDSVTKHKVREITASRYFRKPVSWTFHGRDIFAPAAAHLASGLAPAKLGKRIENPVRLDISRPVRTGAKRWSGVILKIDRYGNVVTNFRSASWRRLGRTPFRMKIGRGSVALVAANYAEMPAGELCLIPGSAGYLEVSANQESAGELLGVASGENLELLL